MCGKHELKEHGQCIGLNASGKRCAKVGPLCNKHRMEQQVIKDEQFAEAMWERLIDDFDAGHVTLDEVEEQIHASADMGGLTAAWRDRLIVRTQAERNHQEFFAQHHEVPLHADNQNVHRAVISDQTNRGMQILLAQKVPEDQDTLTEIWNTWALWEPVPEPLKKDMRGWYDQSSCRHPNDWLYRKTLDGLWAMVKGNSELVDRLADEADESLGMCCEGHLCRLVNVMVGFDERFEIQISKKEQLQQKMAEISMREVSAEQKALDAWKWMEANGIPEGERSAWVDAF